MYDWSTKRALHLHVIANYDPDQAKRRLPHFVTQRCMRVKSFRLFKPWHSKSYLLIEINGYESLVWSDSPSRIRTSVTESSKSMGVQVFRLFKLQNLKSYLLIEIDNYKSLPWSDGPSHIRTSVTRNSKRKGGSSLLTLQTQKLEILFTLCQFKVSHFWT